MSKIENNISGVLLVNKHKGVTSHDIVNKIRRLYSTKKVGHTGTLDPLATGVLPILIGRSAKASEYLLSENKEYVAHLRLGLTTDTEDITGKVLTTSEMIPTREEFFEACRHFVGEITQVPPMYSALKVNGQKLVDLARQGIEIERQGRKINIYSILPEEVSEIEGVYKIRVACSKGTYIRTLCADIGAFLGCGATMTELERTVSGNFKIEDTYTIDQLENMSPQERNALLIPTEELFGEAKAVTLPDFYSRLFRSGCEIYLAKIKASFPLDTFLRVYDGDGFLALGQVKEYEQGLAIKSIKLFRI
ncbi:MAG: tRNA pseudouridine(55) synthase TruB [Clostridia bacterium]|nr:tRNA pseudouridine(55) synthase TruB [Clostridia bacterium]